MTKRLAHIAVFGGNAEVVVLAENSSRKNLKFFLLKNVWES